MKTKRIGWIVEWRLPQKIRPPKSSWVNFDGLAKAWASKTDAIDHFEERCGFWFIPLKVINSRSRRAKYHWLRNRGYARCVPVYVEDRP